MVVRLAVLFVFAASGCTCGPPADDRGCDGGPRNTFGGACGSDAGPGAVCILGTWLPSPPPPCDPGPCGVPSPPQAECQRADCRYYPYSIYLDDGGRWIGAYVGSHDAGTFSSTSRPRLVAYAVCDGGLVDQNGKFQSLSCTDTEMVQGGYAVYARAPVGLSGTLRVLSEDGGTWAGLPWPAD